MSSFSQYVKLGLRSLSSIGCAVKGKYLAKSGQRKPSRTCQLPGLAQLIDSRISPSHAGVFVEVGAYDGERFSNTSWLADCGWQGYYIEPSRRFSRWCKLRHMFNRVTVVNLAAGESESQATLMQVGALSTISTETFDEYSRIGWAKKLVSNNCQHKSTKISTLDHILASRNIATGFEVLVVDVEGYEENVFMGFDIRRWRPKLMIVELCDIHPSFRENTILVESACRVRERIIAAGYHEIHRDEINTVFERNAAGDTCVPQPVAA